MKQTFTRAKAALATAFLTLVVSGQALARTIGSSVAQTLANEPGIAVRFDGPGAAAPIVSVDRRGRGSARPASSPAAFR